jgi:hypothetical protein
VYDEMSERTKAQERVAASSQVKERDGNEDEDEDEDESGSPVEEKRGEGEKHASSLVDTKSVRRLRIP